MGNSQSYAEEFKQHIEKELEAVALDSSPDAPVIRTKGRGPIKPATHCVKTIELDLQPIQRNEFTTQAFDGRTQILTTAEWPYSVHGLITFKADDLKAWGTGVLIAPHIVLTAGHNLYDFKKKVYYDIQDMKFCPGMNGQILPFGLIKVEKVLISPNYIKEGKQDYGLLVLKEPVGEMTGYFGLACLEREEIEQKKVNITGYPSDKVVLKPKTYEMWGMEGIVAHADPDRGLMNHLIDTAAGQSGSGVWYQEGEDYYVCGVHVTGNELVNQATLLTRAMYKQIHTWVEQEGLKQHLLQSKPRTGLWFYVPEINVECVSLLLKYNLDNLVVLQLDGKKIGDEEVKILAQNTSWTNLSRLSLERNNIGAEGARALAQNNSWTNLTELLLIHNNIGSEGAKALAQNTSWKALSKLHLFWNNIGAEGAKGLAQNTTWSGLTELLLARNKVENEGAKALAQNTSWVNLSVLYLSYNHLGVEGAKALGQNTSWTKLKELYLGNNYIRSEGAKALAENTSWTRLKKLELGENIIGAEGAKALSQNKSWANLSELSLWKNHIGAEGAIALAQNTSWTNLSQLNLSNNHLGEEEYNILRQNKTWKETISIAWRTDRVENDFAQQFPYRYYA